MRKLYLDHIRSLATLVVVMWHTAIVFSDIHPAYGTLGPFAEGQLSDLFVYIVYPWMLPIFFVIAGIGAKLFFDKHDEREFIRSKTRKLLIPSTLGLFVFQFISGIYNAQMTDAFTVLDEMFPRLSGYIPHYFVYVFAGISSMWFAQTLWILSMALIPVRRLEKGRLCARCAKLNLLQLLLLVVPYYLLAQILNTPYAVLYRFGSCGFLFFSGYFVFSHEEVIAVLKKNAKWLLPAGILLDAVYTIRTFGLNPMIDPYAKDIVLCVSSWVTVLALLGCGAKYLDRESKVFSFLKKEAWGVYVLHYVPLIACASALRRTPLGADPYLCYPLTLLSGLAGAYLLNRVIRRIPFLRYCILGISVPRQQRK